MEQALPVPPRTWVHPELSGVLFCSICSLLCSVLMIVVCLFVFCLLTIACHSNYGFWLPFRFLQTFRITASDYLLGFFRLFELRLLITFWVSSDFSNYGFWLPFGFLQTFLITSSDYLLGFFRLFELWLLITFCVSSDFSNYGFWLPFGFLQTFRITASDYLLRFFRLFLHFFAVNFRFHRFNFAYCCFLSRLTFVSCCIV